MTSIYALALQTLSAALVAALLMVLKVIFADKLSPRWQYGVWSLLAARILLPVGTGRGILVPRLPIWMEVFKSQMEQSFSSAYASVYEPISLTHVLPVFSGPPRSLTDWLLVLYAAAGLFLALRYLLSYARLRLLLRRGTPPGQEMEERLAEVCRKYGLKGCPMVAVEGLPSAFVCGVFRPVLALPAGEAVDEKILLHELLHLKHHDALQNAFWCALGCLQPLLRPVFRLIENDMETLCDQRVLERLEGEERREYGLILLSMASGPYARCPGTTSISNGAAFLARRIEAIVRFKKYPKGMALVSLCILAALVSPTLWGTAVDVAALDHEPDSPDELWEALAAARLDRCSTVSGAIDCYAKGLMKENGIYIAMAAPPEAHEALSEEMLRGNREEGWAVRHLDSGVELEYVRRAAGYTVLDLTAQRDGSYLGYLAFEVDALLDQYGHGWERSGDPYNIGHVILPIRVYPTGTGWCVEETDRRLFTSQVAEKDLPYPGKGYTDVGYPSKTLTAEGKSGTVTILWRTSYTVGGDENWSWPWETSQTEPARDPDPAKALPDILTLYDLRYTPSADPSESYTIQVIPLTEGEEPSFHTEPYSNHYGYDSDGSVTVKDWRGQFYRNMAGLPHLADYHREGEKGLKPLEFHVRIWWDDEEVETLVLNLF